jgi:hypothetical protein
MGMNKKIIILVLMGVIIFTLSACGRIRNIVPGRGNSNQPTKESTDSNIGKETSDLVNALRDAGAKISIGDAVKQPFFPVAGMGIEVNDASIQVFEFADPAARQQVSDVISPTGDKIGTSMPTWIARPNFWASGSLIVLYLGEDQALIDLLSNDLGTPITQPAESSDQTPQAVLQGQRVLAQDLNVALEDMQLVEYVPMEWSDGCLGLGRADEGCLAVITPGWRAVFEVNGQRYEVRTDESGDIVRWQQLDGEGSTNKAFIYLIALESKGDEVIGCGDSLIPVEITLQNQVQPVKDALSQLLALHDQYYGDSGLYNSLYQSNLTVDSVMIDSSGAATVNLSGELMLGGVCDVPRVEAQLERTATQFSNVPSVTFYLNGQLLKDALSLQGESDVSASFNGISFVYPSTLAGQAAGENVPASAARPGFPFISQIPEHIRFRFESYSNEKTGLKPQVIVVSVDKLREIQPGAGNLIALLRTIMSIKPELLIDYMGMLPFVDTSDMMFAQVEAVEFQNGNGVRFLTQYSPNKEPINNLQLFYTFQGLTDDGKYYVATVLPVSYPDLPDLPTDITGQERADLERDYPAYLERIKSMLDDAPAESFLPDLAVLDEMIASLQITGTE